MNRKRRTHSAEFKAQVALEALKGVSEIAREYEVHPGQIGPRVGRKKDPAVDEDHGSGADLPEEEAPFNAIPML